eukprot:3132927-Heterocapsa_arctica.AAC.1
MTKFPAPEQPPLAGKQGRLSQREEGIDRLREQLNGSASKNEPRPTTTSARVTSQGTGRTPTTTRATSSARHGSRGRKHDFSQTTWEELYTSRGLRS